MGLVKGLSLVDTELSGLQSLNVDLTGATLAAKNSSIKVIAATPTYSLNLGSGDFGGLINIVSGEVAINGSGSISKVQGKGILRIAGNHLFKNFSLDGGSELIFESGSVQTFTDTISLKAQSGNRISFKSDAAAAASFSFDKYYKICFDFLDVTNINVTGQSVVNSGVNSILTNSANWLMEDCASITFPDFTFQSNCVNSATIYTNKSNGPITSYAWNFGDPSSGTNTSALESPVHTYSQAGSYAVTLEVGNGGAPKKQVTKTVDVVTTNALPTNHIVINNSKLTSFVAASKYTWIVNEALIDNSNTRAISFTDKPGDYAVLIFDDVCNRRSDPFVIAGLEEVTASRSSEFLIYPNPTEGRIFLQKKTGVEISSIRVTDMLGRSHELEITQSNDTIQIDLRASEKGMYIIQIWSNAGLFKEKIIVR